MKAENIVVAIAYDKDGNKYDECWSWETGQNYSLHEGKKVVAIADDGSMTKEKAQALYDNDLASYKDCWGITNAG